MILVVADLALVTPEGLVVVDGWAGVVVAVGVTAVAVDVDVKVFALALRQLVARGEAPFLVELLKCSDDTGLQNSLKNQSAFFIVNRK